MSEAYHQSRLTHDPRRSVVWDSLWRFHFRHLIQPGDCVLDLGCGHCDFINSVHAARRIAVDSWAGFPALADAGVETILSDVTALDRVADGSVDFAFASNLFEHLNQEAFARVLDQLRRKLSARGTLNILQPNYRYAFREYFDDYTHVAVYSDISLVDFLAAHGFATFDVRPRFLPLTVKSRLPIAPWLIGAYLAFPLKPLAKQMFVRARPAQANGGRGRGDSPAEAG